MSKINYRMKQAETAFHYYMNSSYSNLFSAYSKPSKDKINAFTKCKNKQVDLDGFDFRIISKNTYIFTCGFKYINMLTGKKMFYYITPYYEISIEI